MSQYRVTVTLELEAEDRHQAAMRAHSLLNDMTPLTFDIKDAASISKEVTLTEEEGAEALKPALSFVLDATAFTPCALG